MQNEEKKGLKQEFEKKLQRSLTVEEKEFVQWMEDREKEFESMDHFKNVV